MYDFALSILPQIKIKMFEGLFKAKIEKSESAWGGTGCKYVIMPALLPQMEIMMCVVVLALPYSHQ